MLERRSEGRFIITRMYMYSSVQPAIAAISYASKLVMVLLEYQREVMDEM